MAGKQLTIGCAVIAKNEGEHIGRLLESIKDADQVVVCDTGSVDNGDTVRIAKEHGAEVYEDYKWNDSFCEARNHVKGKMKTDWIFSADCDEFVHDWSKVKEAVALAEEQGITAINITQIAEDSGQTNTFPRLFKNSPAIWWNGAIHNHLNVIGQKVGDVKLTYGYSLAHLGDPDRALRILEKEVKKGTGTREMYYLGREYYYRKRYQECTAILGQYVQQTRFLPEKADAFLMMARCYWQQRMPDDARDACAQAIILNINFKEALLFMSELQWPKLAEKWRECANLADNSDVLFVRT